MRSRPLLALTDCNSMLWGWLPRSEQSEQKRPTGLQVVKRDTKLYS